MKINTAEFIVSNSEVDKCPKDFLPEYAFIGRSNVGKSSLLNTLTNRKGLAKSSSTPGKTQLINYFENDKLQDEKSSAAASLDPSEKLFSHVIEGKTKGLEETVSELLETTEPLEIINNILLSAMKQVGVRFQNGTTQLPFVLKSAEVVKKACSIVEPHIKSGEVNKKGTIVLATVKGDIHDIGKNLVDIILSNNGYTVHNIGTDRSAAEIAAAVDEIRPDAAGLSALLVKSALEMKNVAQFLSSNGMEIPLICGGAALTNDFVEKEVAPLNRKSAYYANDAFEAMNILEKLKNG